MQTYKEIKDSFVLRRLTNLREREKLENDMARAEVRFAKRKAAINKKAVYVKQDLIEPLAKSLKERLGVKAYDIYGPFGIESEMSIYLSNDGKDGDIAICNVETLSITLRPYLEDNNVSLTYWTGEKTNDYAPGTIGYLNGLNKVFAPLPEDIEEIVKLLR